MLLPCRTKAWELGFAGAAGAVSGAEGPKGAGGEAIIPGDIPGAIDATGGVLVMDGPGAISGGVVTGIVGCIGGGAIVGGIDEIAGGVAIAMGGNAIPIGGNPIGAWAAVKATKARDNPSISKALEPAAMILESNRMRIENGRQNFFFFFGVN